MGVSKSQPALPPSRSELGVAAGGGGAEYTARRHQRGPRPGSLGGAGGALVRAGPCRGRNPCWHSGGFGWSGGGG